MSYMHNYNNAILTKYNAQDTILNRSKKLAFYILTPNPTGPIMRNIYFNKTEKRFFPYLLTAS